MSLRRPVIGIQCFNWNQIESIGKVVISVVLRSDPLTKTSQ